MGLHTLMDSMVVIYILEMCEGEGGRECDALLSVLLVLCIYFLF